MLSALERSFASFPTEDKDERQIWLLAQVCYIQSDDMQLGGKNKEEEEEDEEAAAAQSSPSGFITQNVGF